MSYTSEAIKQGPDMTVKQLQNNLEVTRPFKLVRVYPYMIALITINAIKFDGLNTLKAEESMGKDKQCAVWWWITMHKVSKIWEVTLT